MNNHIRILRGHSFKNIKGGYMLEPILEVIFTAHERKCGFSRARAVKLVGSGCVCDIFESGTSQTFCWVE